MYDTLMQMGRWFGYRRGYELLPRLWITEKTKEQFVFLSQLDQAVFFADLVHLIGHFPGIAAVGPVFLLQSGGPVAYAAQDGAVRVIGGLKLQVLLKGHPFGASLKARQAGHAAGHHGPGIVPRVHLLQLFLRVLSPGNRLRQLPVPRLDLFLAEAFRHIDFRFRQISQAEPALRIGRDAQGQQRRCDKSSGQHL